MFTHTYTMQRPNTSQPFWFDTPAGNNPALFVTLQNQLITDGHLISVTRNDSLDDLTLTRTIVCPTSAEFDTVIQAVESEFPGNFQLRIDYAALHSHEISVSNVDN